ncbi:MAG: hypothetical protein AAF493_27930, partial [Pseudomonadota bacterium]
AGVDHQWGANWKVHTTRSGARRMVWKSSPVKHGASEGTAEVLGDRLCISYVDVPRYEHVCSAVYYTGTNRYELWRDGAHRETYYIVAN